MNSLEKYEEIVHEYGSWEKYMESMKKPKKFIDPPSGWKYGFPKEVPDDIEDTNQWLIENGYPKEEIEKLGEYFYCRYWIKND